MYSLSLSDILGWVDGESEEVKIHRMNQIIPKAPAGIAR